MGSAIKNDASGGRSSWVSVLAADGEHDGREQCGYGDEGPEAGDSVVIVVCDVVSRIVGRVVVRDGVVICWVVIRDWVIVCWVVVCDRGVIGWVVVCDIVVIVVSWW
nr:hypothetical protein [Natrarchaeobaculum aegyptiacum]